MKIEMTRERWGRVVLTDERLDELARRFVEGEVRELIGIRFDQYLDLGPDVMDELAERMRQGLAVLRKRETEAAYTVVWLRAGDTGPRVVVPLGHN